MQANDKFLSDELMKYLKGDPGNWLLEEDRQNPGVRLFTFRELMDLPEDDPRVVEAQQLVMQSGPVPVILFHQREDGTWERDKDAYNPKYFSTVWQVMMLAQLGADGKDRRVKQSCEYLLNDNRCRYGSFTFVPRSVAGLIHCLQGNICTSLIDLGWLGDERLDEALDWMARSVTGEGIAPSQEKDADVRYYRRGNSGPGFLCSAQNHKACAWGAVKVMLALSRLPDKERTPSIRRAIEAGIDLLLGVDPATADYPTFDDRKPSGSWFKFGYPVFYVTDVLQNMEALTALGYGSDPRLKNAVELVLAKQDEQGRWPMEYTYNGKTWVDIEEKKQPSKWVTLRVLRVLQRIDL